MKEEKTIDKNVTALIVEAARKYTPNTTFISHFGKKSLVTEESEIKVMNMGVEGYDIYINKLLVYTEGKWADIIND